MKAALQTAAAVLATAALVVAVAGLAWANAGWAERYRRPLGEAGGEAGPAPMAPVRMAVILPALAATGVAAGDEVAFLRGRHRLPAAAGEGAAWGYRVLAVATAKEKTALVLAVPAAGVDAAADLREDGWTLVARTP